MAGIEKLNLDQITFDANNLYREENITDLRIGSLQVLTPVNVDGDDDPLRPVLYTGQTQLMSGAGPLPISAPIEATSIKEAIEKFPEAVRVAVDRLMDEAREMQREAASRIVVPGKDPGGGISLH